MNKRSIITTADGSHTLYVPKLDQHYHSTHGAINESTHVFIEAGLKYCSHSKDTINILEMGLGTGLNAFLTFLNARKVKVNYTAIENYPLDRTEWTALNYFETIGAKEFREVFNEIHQSEWEKKIKLSSVFEFQKIGQDLLEIQLGNNQFDLIYFDAFSPNVQPELWSKNVFNKLYQSLTKDGILVTYCAKGQVKRDLAEVGFTIEPLPGPMGKREITRAIK